MNRSTMVSAHDLNIHFASHFSWVLWRTCIISIFFHCLEQHWRRSETMDRKSGQPYHWVSIYYRQPQADPICSNKRPTNSIPTMNFLRFHFFSGKSVSTFENCAKMRSHRQVRHDFPQVRSNGRTGSRLCFCYLLRCKCYQFLLLFWSTVCVDQRVLNLSNFVLIVLYRNRLQRSHWPRFMANKSVPRILWCA